MKSFFATSVITLLLVIVSLFVASAAAAEDDSSAKKCLPFSSLTSISFEPGMTTTRRRTANQPRMSCVGNCPSDVSVTAAQCRQTGVSDNGLPSWKCTGMFAGQAAGDNHDYRLGSVKVSCEGCAKSGDSDVVAGSCVLKYSIESRARSSSRIRAHGHHFNSVVTTHRYEPAALTGFDVFVICFIVFATCFCCIKVARDQQARYGRGSPLSSNNGNGVYDNKYLHETEQQQQAAAGNGVVHHYHHGNGYGYGGGYGGGGFWNGMLLGSMWGGGWGWGGGGTHITNNTYYDSSYDSGSSSGGGGGDSGWSDGGGFGGSSSD